MRERERVVAGMSCSEVLRLLGDYVDATLDAESRAHVDAHLRGCDWCARFGGRYAAVVRNLQQQVREEESLPADVAGRLSARLRKR